ncbi:MAG: right-handed parallel beta-helix repeat-containing protein [Rikenellaceae bacterium]
MKKRIKGAIMAILTFACVCLSPNLFGAESTDVINVNSLEELMPYLKKDNIHIKLAPGTYKYTTKEAGSRKYRNTAEVVQGKLTYALILIEGNGCTYDFTDVKIEVDTKVFNAYEGSEFVELHVLGSNNVVKNLELEDIGHALDFPQWGCVNVVVDGEKNRIEGVIVRSKGSFPYGYGELFGKGGPTTIKHKKHSAFLVRGLENHIKDCQIYHRAYGHCLFMQAADRPLIEGCYIEGALTTTDKVLEEAGTGSRADKIDFKTVWGYKVPKGYTIALTEAGIRAYNTGNTMINGERFTKRTTSNATVRGCTVKNARVGVVIAHSAGKNLVEDCTVIGVSSTGYSVNNNNTIRNCRADATFGPVFVVPYERNRNITADITITGYPKGENRYVGNGSKQVAYIVGTGHKITLRQDPSLSMEDDVLEGMRISVGGDSESVGDLAEVKEWTATDIVLDNQTSFPVELEKGVTGSTVTSVGKVTDIGSNNSITQK